MQQLEDTCWWHRGIRAIMAGALGARIGPGSILLDMGYGTGGSLASHSNYCATAVIDAHLEAVRLSQERCLDNNQQAAATRIPFKDETCTHATCCGVLQSIPCDQIRTNETLRVLKPGGLPYATAQGAIDRYSRNDLETILRLAGCSIERSNCANLVSRPLTAVIRLASRMLHPPGDGRTKKVRSNLFALPRLLSEALLSACGLEQRNATLGKLPVDLRSTTIAHKPGTPVATIRKPYWSSVP